MSAQGRHDEGTARRRGQVPATLGALLTAATLLLPAATSASPAAASSCPESLSDRSEPGDEVTVVGYTAGCLTTADVAAVAAGRPPTIVGYLHSDPCVDVDLPYCTDPREATEPEHGTVLGHFTLSTATDAVRGQRMELAFELPAGLASGLYYLVVCREPCAAAGTTVDAAGATPLYVGVDPPPDGRPIRAWPLDDPAVAALPDDALISPSSGRTMTGAEARAATGATGTTDVVAGYAEDAAAPAGDALPGHPPTWWPLPAIALLAAGLAALARGRHSGRKQVRHP